MYSLPIVGLVDGVSEGKGVGLILGSVDGAKSAVIVVPTVGEIDLIRVDEGLEL